MKQSQEGLSLLEMLVVFTIVSMVSVLLVQGFGFGVSLYQRVNESGPGAQKMAMSRNWFREVNSALVVQNDPLMTLLGDAGRIKAYSLNPLFGAPGKPTQIVWTLNDGELKYEESGIEVAIDYLAGDAVFEYQMPSGEWVVPWPLSKNVAQLPKALRIKSDKEHVTALLGMRLQPDGLLEENLRDRE